MTLPAPVRAVGLLLAVLIGGPIYIAFLFVFLGLWLSLTVSGIGPLLQWLRTRVDRRILATVVDDGSAAAAGGKPRPVFLLQVPANPLSPSPSTTTRGLAVRWTPNPTSPLPPVAIPNGLGATLISISTLHERLAALGFPVLTYDRAGVGLSDPLPDGVHHFDAAATVADMHALLTDATHIGPTLSPSQKASGWILVGPSMGSIVAQAYMAVHPTAVCGFLNLDGFPFPFAHERPLFSKAALVYRVYAAIIWTGALRPFLFGASATAFFRRIVSATFPAPVVLAQMNQRNFYLSLAAEMITMMDCADAARAAWGPGYDLQLLDSATLRPLTNARPALNGDQPDGAAAKGFVPLPRSKWEHGDDWAAEEETSAVLARLAKVAAAAPGGPAPLPALFASRLVVRAMSGRNYNFPGGKHFYKDRMKDWAAAEHTLHARLARDGRRTAFPSRHHGNIFFGTIEYAAQLVQEIAEGVRKQRDGSAGGDGEGEEEAGEKAAGGGVEVAVTVAAE
jgi:pimeloyl-ACP methyl ester carboxylesterase